MKKSYLAGISFIISFGLVLQAVAFSPSIPLNTLHVAQEAMKNEVSEQNSQSEIVRVGIGNQSFGSYVYKNIGIYATAPLEIYENGNFITKVGANTNINISINPDKTYSLTTDSGNETAKLSGIIKFTATGGCLGVKGLKRAGKPALYHGYFEVMPTNGGNQFNLVNKLPVEVYLRGVVPNEMPVSFGLEALKAQSVAARNYVLSPRTKASPNYDVVDSVASQVYYGANTEKGLSNKAVAETEGLVALYGWDLILAQYSSTAGGYTESYSNSFSDPKTGSFPSSEKPYLVAKPDMITQNSLKEEDDAAMFYKSRPSSFDIRSPYYRWERSWTPEELKIVLESNLPVQSATGFVKPSFSKGDMLSEIEEIKVKRRGDSGKIIELEIVTKHHNYRVYKELVIRRLFTKDGKALPSANVVFENIKDEDDNLTEIKAYGGGFGHGVGMSQFGAGFMGGELHKSFDNILQHYYTDIVIGTKPVIISSVSTQNSAVQTFWANKKEASLVVDNKFQVSKINVNINGKDYVFNLTSGGFGGSRYSKVDISDYIKIGKNKIIYSYPEDERGRKAIRLYVELVGKNDEYSIWR